MEESCLSDGILELWVIWLSSTGHLSWREGLLIRIQLGNIVAEAYVTHQGRTRRFVTARQRILSWAELHVPAMCALYIPGVDNWRADYTHPAATGSRGIVSTLEDVPDLRFIGGDA